MTYTGQDRIDSFFAHHGIKGQKWGVRRFQNPDGTLTELGKSRINKIKRKNYKPNSYASRFNREDKFLKKGDIASRVISDSYARNGETMPKKERERLENKKDIYVSAGKANLKKDTDFYVSWFTDSMWQPEGVSVRTLQFKTNVKVASGKKVWDSLMKEIGDTKLSDIKNDKGSYMSSAFDSDRAKRMVGKKYSNALKKYFESTTLKEAIEENEKYGYGTSNKRTKKGQWLDIISQSGEMATRYAALKFTSDKAGTKEKVIRALKKEGYGALEDINDPDTELPVILFDAPKQVKTVESINAETYAERRRKEEKYKEA